MKRIQEQSAYHKLILILLLLMALLFVPIYASTIGTVGFLYWGELFVPRIEGNTIVYEGKLQGADVSFSVDGSTVSFTYAGRSYAPFTVRRDDTAIPSEYASMPNIVGYEITEGDEIYYRGGAMQYDNGSFLLYGEDGFQSSNIVIYAPDAIVTDQDGNIIDTRKPSASTLIKLVNDPILTHKGEWAMYAVCAVVSALLALTILFADELFYFRIALRVNEPEQVTPSELELAGRYIGDTLAVIVLFVAYLKGLTL